MKKNLQSVFPTTIRLREGRMRLQQIIQIKVFENLPIHFPSISYSYRIIFGLR